MAEILELRSGAPFPSATKVTLAKRGRILGIVCDICAMMGLKYSSAVSLSRTKSSGSMAMAAPTYRKRTRMLRRATWQWYASA